jgi:hypothetical protein
LEQSELKSPPPRKRKPSHENTFRCFDILF